MRIEFEVIYYEENMRYYMILKRKVYFGYKFLLWCCKFIIEVRILFFEIMNY